MNITRHVAKMANTDQRCVVAFMQIPNREDHALIIPMDSLPPRYEQAVMDILRTPEGQQEETFANVLSRHLMPDTGETILQALHNNQKLVAVPVANVLMLPQPNRPVKLSTILEELGRLPKQQLTESNQYDKFNPHMHNMQADATENSRAIARNLMVEAEMLEAEAKKKREAAYMRDPSLRPVGAGHVDTNLVNESHQQAETSAVPTKQVDPLEARMAALEEMIIKIAGAKHTDIESKEVPLSTEKRDTHEES